MSTSNDEPRTEGPLRMQSRYTSQRSSSSDYSATANEHNVYLRSTSPSVSAQRLVCVETMFADFFDYRRNAPKDTHHRRPAHPKLKDLPPLMLVLA